MGVTCPRVDCPRDVRLPMVGIASPFYDIFGFFIIELFGLMTAIFK